MISCIMNFFTEPCLLFSVIGKLCVCYVAFRAAFKAWQLMKLYILSPSLGLSLDLKTVGKWAVVTGATDGIGKAYAEELARRGMKLVLVSRTASRLTDTAKEIESKYSGTEVKCVVADFADMDVYKDIKQQLEGLDIAVLVNNVGMSYDTPSFVHEISEEEVRKLLIVNTFSVIFMTRIVLDRMRAKKAGLIVNIASVSGRFPAPLLAIYAATKAFVRSLSLSMQIEYQEDGVLVQSVSPSLVATKMSKISRTSFIVPSPHHFASSCINTIGLHHDVAGCLGHEVLTTAMSLMGDKMAGGLFFKSLLASRKKAQQKKLKEQKKQ